jgi:hypothetical protein
LTTAEAELAACEFFGLAENELTAAATPRMPVASAFADMAASPEFKVLTGTITPTLFEVPVSVVTKTPLGPDVVTTVVMSGGRVNCNDGNGLVDGINGGSAG